MDLPEHIRFLELSQSPPLTLAADSLLTPEEAERQASFRSKGRRESFALGRYAARTLLGQALNCEPGQVGIAILEDGSLISPGAPWNLSISHSGRFAAAAISKSEIGLDLEIVKDRPDGVFRFVLHPDEVSLRDRIDLPKAHQLALFWTLKESVLKAKRTGLRRSPKSLRLEIDLENGTAVIVGQRVWNARFDMREDHVVAVSWLADNVL
ncbi:MAG: phosphopantetheinyl transferase [Rhodothermales bacterium]|jgi:phosphopantetheinyl transferase